MTLTLLGIMVSSEPLIKVSVWVSITALHPSLESYLGLLGSTLMLPSNLHSAKAYLLISIRVSGILMESRLCLKAQAPKDRSLGGI